MRLTRALLACGIAGPVLFSTVVLIEGATRPGYSAWRNAASQLALGDQGWMQTVNFFVGGLLFAGFAIGLWRTLRSGPASTWAPRLIAGMGVSFVLAGSFPINPGLGYPPGVAPSYSLHGAIHFVAATLLVRSEEHTSELQSHSDIVCRLLLEKKKHQNVRAARPGGNPSATPEAR